MPFVTGLASEDVVEAIADARGRLVFRRRTAASGNCTIRVILLPDGAWSGRRAEALRTFEHLRARGEGSAAFGMIAQTIPATSDIPTLKELIRRGCDLRWWDCDEGCVTAAWLEQPPAVRAPFL